MSLRTIFFGNSESVFSSRHFAALLESPCHLVGVVDVPPGRRISTNPLPPGLPDFVDAARERGVRCFKPANVRDSAWLADLGALAPDLFIAAGYALILSTEALALPRHLAANFHASLLPAYRGKHPVFWTLRGDERWAGLTVHAMDRGIDTGDILYQVRLRTRREDTVAALYERIMDRSVALVGRLLRDAGRGSVPRRPQPAGEGGYFSSTTEEDFRIRWTWPGNTIRRCVTMTPGRCFAGVGGGKVFLGDARSVALRSAARPGEIVAMGRSRCTVAAGEGGVSLGWARPEGGDPSSVAALCRRRGLVLGDMLT